MAINHASSKAEMDHNLYFNLVFEICVLDWRVTRSGEGRDENSKLRTLNLNSRTQLKSRKNHIIGIYLGNVIVAIILVACVVTC